MATATVDGGCAEVVGSRHARSGRKQNGCRCLADMDSSDGRALGMEGAASGVEAAGAVMGNVGSVSRRELANSSVGRRTQVGSRELGRTDTVSKKELLGEIARTRFRRQSATALAVSCQGQRGVSAGIPRTHVVVFCPADWRQSSLDCGKGVVQDSKKAKPLKIHWSPLFSGSATSPRPSFPAFIAPFLHAIDPSSRDDTTPALQIAIDCCDMSGFSLDSSNTRPCIVISHSRVFSIGIATIV